MCEKIMRTLLAVALFFAGTVYAEAQNRWMTIVNDTGVTMTNFYASNEGSNSWGGDWLGSIVLNHNFNIEFNFDDGSGYCMWDFKANFADGDSVESLGVNVCQETSWTYY